MCDVIDVVLNGCGKRYVLPVSWGVCMCFRPTDRPHLDEGDPLGGGESGEGVAHGVVQQLQGRGARRLLRFTFRRLLLSVL